MQYIDLTKDFIDRLEMSKFMPFDSNVYSLHNTYMYYKLLQLPVNGYYRVTSEIMRADTISYNLFSKNESYWWLILLYNGICKYQDLKANMILKVFDLNDFIPLISRMSTKQQLLNQELGL